MKLQDSICKMVSLLGICSEVKHGAARGVVTQQQHWKVFLPYTTKGRLCLQKPCTEEPMSAKLQLSEQGCTECLKQGLKTPESELGYLPQ